MMGSSPTYWTARFGHDARTLVLAKCGTWWHINWIIAGGGKGLGHQRPASAARLHYGRPCIRSGRVCLVACRSACPRGTWRALTMNTTYWIATELPTGEHFVFVTYASSHTGTWTPISNAPSCIEDGATPEPTGPGYNPKWDRGLCHWLVRGCSSEEYDLLLHECKARAALGGSP